MIGAQPGTKSCVLISFSRSIKTFDYLELAGHLELSSEGLLTGLKKSCFLFFGPFRIWGMEENVNARLPRTHASNTKFMLGRCGTACAMPIAS